MDPTYRKHPKPTSSTSSAATNHRHQLRHPQPDPTIIPPSAIQNISYRFSKLYANHSIIKPPLNSQPPLLHPEPDTDFEPNLNPLFFPQVSDTPCTTLTKSNSQRERRKDVISVSKMGKIVGKEKPLHPGPKKLSFGEREENCTSKDVKKASELISKSLDSNGSCDKLKKISSFQQAAAAGTIEVRMRSSRGIPGAGDRAGGRRKSFCSSAVQLADFFSCTGVKVVAVDMPPFMQIHAVDSARKAQDSLGKFTSKSLALTLKREFDGVYGPAWHCVVGTSFGSFVTHSVGGFMYFSMDDKLYVLLFKTTVQRAE